MILTIIIGISILILVCFILYKFKAPLVGNFTGITGGNGTGKSTTAIYYAYKYYRRQRRQVKIRNAIRKVLHLKNKEEEPLLYSNIPLDIKGYTPFTEKLLLREERFRYKSVVYLNETSLIADSQCWGIDDIDDKLNHFCKLIRHETKGGFLFWDTQCISDLHFAFKKCTSNYIYIYKMHKIPLLPFIWIDYNNLYYSYDGNMQNINEGDIRDETKTSFIWKRIWKKFDTYCYSILTDGKKVEEHTIKPKTLKTENIVSIKKWYLENKKRGKSK